MGVREQATERGRAFKKCRGKIGKKGVQGKKGEFEF